MNMVSKVLIIGAGIGQVPLCRLIKQRGLFLIVVTIPGDYPCIALADKVYYIDIYDREEIVEWRERRTLMQLYQIRMIL